MSQWIINFLTLSCFNIIFQLKFFDKKKITHLFFHFTIIDLQWKKSQVYAWLNFVFLLIIFSSFVASLLVLLLLYCFSHKKSAKKGERNLSSAFCIACTWRNFKTNNRVHNLLSNTHYAEHFRNVSSVLAFTHDSNRFAKKK